MKILHLTLKKIWFDLIASGQKKNEYREYKDYWKTRLMESHMEFKQYDEIHFRNGYGNDKPFMRVECLSIGYINGSKINYLLNNVQYFDIRLGKVLEVRQ